LTEAPAALAPRETVTQAGERRSTAIESLRALSALAVVACHGYALTNGLDLATYHGRVILGGGFIGVDVFFALTGYLIFLPFARRYFGDRRSVDLRGYALNRALRILPLYYSVLIVLAVVDAVPSSLFVRFALFGENFREALVAKALDGSMWSLVVELHFYLLLPLLAWLIARAARGSALLAAGALLALGAISVGVYEANFAPPEVWIYSLPANFVYFVPGMLLALYRARVEIMGPPRWCAHRLARRDLAVALALALWLALLADFALELRLLPLATLGTALVVGSCVLPLREGIVDRVLGARPLAILGVASYSLYLWHLPLMRWLPHATGAGVGGWLLFAAYSTPVCVLAALLSYRLIEYPALRLRRRWFTAPATPAGTIVAG
jgi:peptidoglycan/LPS O-acetylase OafA/YrhL